MTDAATLFQPRLGRRRAIGRLFSALCLVMTISGVGILAVLLGRVVADGWSCVSMKFLTSYPSIMSPENAGIKSSLWGTIWLIAITAAVAVPLGVGAAIYLEEYARKTRFTRFIQLNITNLAGVPSIVYGILGLAIFIRSMALGRSVLAGGLTMALLVLPVIIIAAQEALAAVPSSLRQAAYALGATRWQMVWHHVLPAALPGIATGVILALSRAIGEAAPLVMIGAQAYIAFVPRGLGDAFTALPIQIFNWCDQPQAEFHRLAAGAIIVLLTILLCINGVAIAIRGWQQRKATW
ncbi:MAG TPA: phosphate ABC transporter permease PstA [Phycisphaerae bacterium]|nr:phosphate ABC transporter permease PstA [Phycisphaerae bacterium]HRY69084.1 phosphate ABC transporter permease PstA [Phycisphaerae bacterium]HSA25941.1 phosphate ABC transporter permease PstA [Phycisphaerae bacterium]